MARLGSVRWQEVYSSCVLALASSACSGAELSPAAEGGAPPAMAAPAESTAPASPTGLADVTSTPDALDPSNPSAPSLASPGESGPTPVGFAPGSSEPGGSAPDDGAAESAPTAPNAAGAGLVRGGDPSLESATAPGPFDVETLSSGLRDGPAYGSQTLHVPVGAEPPFAGVAIVPGFISPEAAIRAWGPFLASHGIVALTIGTNTGGDPPEVRARALLDALDTLRAENERPGSPIEGGMALDRLGVMGWSMGGGGTLIAANETPELRAAVSFAAWSPGARFTDNQVPTLMLAGSADGLAGGQSQGFFESMPEATPKMLFEVAGGPHDIANDPRSADGEIGRYGLSWLKVFLEGDERYRQFLLEAPSRQSDFRSNL
jgi:dienelactone hydrolase